jgi:ADP-ribose pyrophosphatase YjhB (NUDIX family)
VADINNILMTYIHCLILSYNYLETRSLICVEVENMSCNNCGKRGHSFYQCKMPITSNGIIAYRKHPETKVIEYLMICRKDSLGLMDFIRGKYSVNNKYYIMNMISQMTNYEKNMLKTMSFDEIWKMVWDKEICPYGAPPGLSKWSKGALVELGSGSTGSANAHGSVNTHTHGSTNAHGSVNTHTHGSANAHDDPSNSRFKSEEHVSREKFNQLRTGIYSGYRGTDKSFYSLETMIDECTQSWDEPEWGFPKGRRNYNESDIDCALREFYEETGLKNKNISFIVSNLAPFEEIFMGSNYKSYKHRYFLMYVDYNMSNNSDLFNIDKTEISKIEWKTFNDSISAIRPYNLEKKRILSNINIVLTNCTNTFA